MKVKLQVDKHKIKVFVIKGLVRGYLGLLKLGLMLIGKISARLQIAYNTQADRLVFLKGGIL